MRGLLLTLEGIEGSGKSTQAAALVQELIAAGVPVIATREPGGVFLGERIREILLSPDSGPIHPTAELLLFSAARAQHVVEKIKPALESGQVVVCDRFTDATVAYQGGGRAVPEELLRRLNELSAGGVRPDRTYLLDVDVPTGFDRAGRRGAGGGPDRIEREGRVFFEAVRRRYLDLAAEEPERILLLRGTDSIRELTRQIVEDALSLIRSRSLIQPR